jgi:hypothetical protein
MPLSSRFPTAINIDRDASHAVFTLWIVLLVMQTQLVASNRTQLHRQLGVVGGIVAVLLTVLAAAAPITRLQAGVFGQVPGAPPAIVLLAVALATVIVFPMLITRHGC